MTAPRDWKSSKVLKISGSVIKEGIFQGRPGEDTSDPNAHKPSKLTPEVIEKAFKNISGPIPIFMTHDMKGQSRDHIGDTFHAGITSSKDDIEIRGMVWKDSAINRINNEGLTKFSPEIDFDFDGQGNIINAHIVGLIPTNSPAISLPPFSAVATVFDKIGEGNMPDIPGTAPVVQPTLQPGADGTIIAPQTPPIVPAALPVNNVANNDNTEILKQINALATAFAQSQEQIKQLTAQHDADRMKTVNTLLGELKALGIANPETLIEGLPVDTKASVLKTIKDTIALKAPVVTPGGSTGAPSKDTAVDKMTGEILKEFGLSRKDYDKMMALPCPSLDREE